MGFVSIFLLKSFVALLLLIEPLSVSSEVAMSETSLISSTSLAPAPSTHYLPIRRLVAVQGVVYCKSCKYQGVDTLLGASPISGAVVRLQCNNSRNSITEETKTDKNGYFLLLASKNVTNYGSNKCKVFLVSSPLISCKKATDLHLGQRGDHLRYQASSKPSPFALYTVGPFSFEPTSCLH